MTGKTEEPCPVCDSVMLEITDDYHERLRDLEEDLRAKLAALVEAHTKGEHETG